MARIRPTSLAASTAESEAPYAVGAVDTALRLLLLLRDRKQVGVSEAARELGVGRSTAHRLLSTLQYRRFVEQDPTTRRYVLGSAVLEVGLSAVGQTDLRAQLRPFVAELLGRLNETVHVIVLSGAAAVFVDGAESSQIVRTALKVGERVPAHASSGGKVLLAELSADALERMYPDRELPQMTAKTLADRDGLKRVLEKVRADGYATNIGESEEQVAAVAMPVRDAFENARGALAVSVPLARLDDDKLSHVIRVLGDVANRASHHAV